MSWSEYEKWSFSIIKDVLAHLQFLLYCILFGLKKKTLEIGSGTGLQSCFVSYFGIEVISIDRDARVAKMASSVSKYYKGKDVSFVVADARYLPFKEKTFGVSFSQGLLEHLDDRTIVEIVSEAKKAVNGKIFFSVPSANFPDQDFGNERLLYPSDWKAILKQFNADAGYYKFDFQSIKNSLLKGKVARPWHILISISSKKNTPDEFRLNCSKYGKC
jgi:2-polyprenyl-3-methyl-5-hydroxy-6-metoxy-1,4-benzoquinol methylase